MGLIGKILEFTRTIRNGANLSEVKTGVGGGRIVTAQNFSPCGDDSSPLGFDYPILVRMPGTGRFAVVGYVDTLNAGEAGAGEKRFYSRDSSGAPIGYVWLRSDGTVGINGLTNHAVQYEALLSAFNQLRDDLDALKDLYNTHTHVYSPGSGSPTSTAATGAQGSDSTADMTGSRVDSVRVP